MFHYIFPFALGVTIAYLLEPLLEKSLLFFRLNKPSWKWVLSVLIILVTIMLVFGPILTLLTTGIHELMSVLTSLQSQTQDQNLLLTFANKTSEILSHFGMSFSANEIVIKSTLFLKGVSHTLLLNIGNALVATPEFILKFVIFILTWCFFLVRGKEWRARFLTKIFPWEKERDLIASTCSSVLKALIVANVLVAVVQAFFIAISLAVFGVPRFILFGMIAFFMSFIPIIGTAPLMLGAAAWCYFSDGRLFAAIGILVSGLVIGLLDSFLRPYFMKGGAEIQFFWIFLAIICGMSLLGVPGAVVGPVSFALFAAALKALELAHEQN